MTSLADTSSERAATWMRVALMALLMVPVVAFVNARGTLDLKQAEAWVAGANKVGLISAYRRIGREFPPLAFSFVTAVARMGSRVGLDPHVSIKASQLLALWVTMGLFWALTRHFWGAFLASVALVVPGAAHGDLDIYYAPLLLCSFVALGHEKHLWFAVFFSLAALVTWQPLVFAPFVLTHVVRSHHRTGSFGVALWKTAWKVVLPVFAAIQIAAAVFGRSALVHSLGLFVHGGKTHFWSLETLNAPWIASYLIEAFHWKGFLAVHGTAAGGDQGAGVVLAIASNHLARLANLPFLAAYGACVYGMWKRPASLTNTWTFCLLGYLSYLVLGTGMHPEAWFPALLLALYMFATGSLATEATVALALAMNLNLLVFNGIEGNGLRFSRVLGGRLDVALCLAVLNCLLFALLGLAVAREKTEPAGVRGALPWLSVRNPCRSLRVMVVLMLAMPSLILINTRGTPDMVFFWQVWIEKIATFGPVEGYRQIWMDYPPLGSQLLGLAHWLGGRFGLDTHDSIKVSLLIALWVSSAVLGMVTRNFWAAVLAFAALALDGVALNFLDIYFAPFFIAALAAFHKRRYAAFAVLYTLALMVKWQPLIIAPFLALHLIRDYIPNRGSLKSGLGSLLRQVAAPMGAVWLLMILIFGWPSLMNALSLTFFGDPDHYWSMFALNLPWIISHFIEVFHPHNFPGYLGRMSSMVRGQGEILALPSHPLQFLTHVPFAVAYLGCLCAVWRRPLDSAHTLLGCAMGALAYFILNTRVHENHIFLAVLVALYLYGAGAIRLEIAAGLALAMNTNLYLFHGLDGVNLRFDRILGDRVDVALLMAIANVIIFFFLLRLVALRRPESLMPSSGRAMPARLE